MPSKRDDQIRRLKSIESECNHVKASIAIALSEAQKNGNILGINNISVSELRSALNNSEQTYFIRMFAAFEDSVRLYRMSYKPNRKPQTEVLLRTVSSKIKCTFDVYNNVDVVRVIRNEIVHGGKSELPESLAILRSHMCKYLAELPPVW